MSYNSWTMFFGNDPQPRHTNTTFMLETNELINSQDPQTIAAGLHALSDRLCFGWTLSKCLEANILPRIQEYLKQTGDPAIKEAALICILRISEIQEGSQLLVYSGLFNEVLKEYFFQQFKDMQDKKQVRTAILILAGCLKVTIVLPAAKDFTIKLICRYFQQTLDYELIESFVPRLNLLSRIGLQASQKKRLIHLCLFLIHQASEKKQMNPSNFLSPMSSLLFLLNDVLQKCPQNILIEELPRIVKKLRKVSFIKELHSQLVILLRGVTISGLDPKQQHFVSAFENAKVLEIVAGILESSDSFGIWDNIYIYLRELLETRNISDVLVAHARLMDTIKKKAVYCRVKEDKSDAESFLLIRYTDLMKRILFSCRETSILYNKPNFSGWAIQLAHRLSDSLLNEQQTLDILGALQKLALMDQVSCIKQFPQLTLRQLKRKESRGTLKERLACQAIYQTIGEDRLQQLAQKTAEEDD